MTDVLPGYYGNLSDQQQSALEELKKVLYDKHGIAEEASPVEERFRRLVYADPDLRYDLELLCVWSGSLVEARPK